MRPNLVIALRGISAKCDVADRFGGQETVARERGPTKTRIEATEIAATGAQRLL